MKIYGLQKVTLLDFPGCVACTVFLGGCDFRCPFCHNFELVDGTAQPIMDDTELMDFLKSRKGLLDGVVITGGEPCIHSELLHFIKRIKAEGYKIKLDTNGYHPDVLSKILNTELVDYVAMDIKNCLEKYAFTCGVDKVNTDLIIDSIHILTNSNIDYEFRTTVVNEFHNKEDIEKIGRMIMGAKRYFLQRFTDRDTVPYKNLTAPSFDKMKKFAEVAARFVPDTKLRGVD